MPDSSTCRSPGSRIRSTWPLAIGRTAPSSWAAWAKRAASIVVRRLCQTSRQTEAPNATRIAAPPPACQHRLLTRTDSRIDQATRSAPRFDEARTELAPDRRNVNVDRVRHDLTGVVVPMFGEHRAREYPAAMPDELLEDPEL